MKNTSFILVSVCLLLCCHFNLVYAVHTVPVQEKVDLKKTEKAQSAVEVGHKTKKQLRKEKRLERRLDKLKRFLAKKGPITIDLTHHIDKWMWYWLIGWSLGLVLSIIAAVMGVVTLGVGGGLVLLFGSIFWILGTACLVIWLLKKFA